MSRCEDRHPRRSPMVVADKTDGVCGAANQGPEGGPSSPCDGVPQLVFSSHPLRSSAPRNIRQKSLDSLGNDSIVRSIGRPCHPRLHVAYPSLSSGLFLALQVTYYAAFRRPLPSLVQAAYSLAFGPPFAFKRILSLTTPTR